MSRPTCTGLLVAALLWSCASQPPKLTAAHREAVESALSEQGPLSPQSLEVSSSGWLVATFELTGQVTPASIRAFAEKAVLAIRNTMQPYNVVDSYRVTLNGPRPGPGLVRRYGSARFIEGGALEWQEAK